MMSTKQQQPKMDWGFYSVVPRIVRTQFKELSHAEKWLYTCLKDLCRDKGVCFRTLRSLSEETDISIASLSTMIPHLHEAGLIHAEKKRRSASGKEIWHITITDIWQANAEYCSKSEQRCSKNEQVELQDQEIVQNPNNVVQKMNEEVPVCSNPERDCSNFPYRRITLKNSSNEEYKGEEYSATSRDSTQKERDQPPPLAADAATSTPSSLFETFAGENVEATRVTEEWNGQPATPLVENLVPFPIARAKPPSGETPSNPIEDTPTSSTTQQRPATLSVNEPTPVPMTKAPAPIADIPSEDQPCSRNASEDQAQTVAPVVTASGPGKPRGERASPTRSTKSKVPKASRDLLSEALPEAQAVIQEWVSIFNKPVAITETLIKHATTLSEYRPEPGEIRACRLWMYATDENGYYRKRGMHLGDVAREFERFRSLACIPVPQKSPPDTPDQRALVGASSKRLLTRDELKAKPIGW